MAVAVCNSYAKTIILKPDAGSTSIYIKDPTVLGYAPGDTLLIQQNISSLYLSGINGTVKDTVVVTSLAGVVIGGATNRSVEMGGCSFIKMYGLYIQGDPNIIGFKSNGCTNLAVENVSVNTASVGFSIKVDPADQSWAYPNYVMRDMSIKNCSAENTHNEGFYIGQTSDMYNGYKTPPIVGLKVRNCSATNTGWDGFQITNAQNCDVSGVKVYNAGNQNQSGQRSGITIQDATTGTFSDLYVDGSMGSGLTIFSCGAVYYNNIVLKNVAKMGGSNAVYVDNRYDRGYNLGAQQLFLTNLVIQGGAPTPTEAMYDLNGTSNGAVAAIPGIVTRLSYDPSLWPKIKDNAKNQYVGGTEGTPDTTRPSPPKPDTNSVTPPSPAPTGAFLSITQDKVTVYYPDGHSDVYNRSGTDTMPLTKPAPPNDLKAVVAGRSVTLTWSAPAVTGGALITSYKIYRTTAARSATPPVAVNNGLSYVDTNVVEGYTYYYKVTAVNSVGESEPTSEVSATVAAVPIPAAPQNLSATGSVGEASLKWSPPTGNTDSITTYNIYRGTTKGFTDDLVATVPNGTTTYTDNNLVAGVYYYTVTDSKGNVQSLKSNEDSADVSQPATTPSAPQSLSLVSGILQATLTWSAPLSNGNAPINNYKIYRGTSSGSGTLLTTVSGSVFTYKDANLTSGQKYYYTVTAVNSAAESPKSNEVSLTASSYTLPAAPLNVKAAASSATVSLSWSAPSNTGGTTITGYKIYRGTSSGRYNPITTLQGNVLNYVDGNKANGTIYYYVISAINSVGEGPFSSEVSAKPQ